MENSQSKEDIHKYRLTFDRPTENRCGEKTMIFFASHMRTNLYKSVKFCHFECRSKQNVGVMFTQMPN